MLGRINKKWVVPVVTTRLGPLGFHDSRFKLVKPVGFMIGPAVFQGGLKLVNGVFWAMNTDHPVVAPRSAFMVPLC